MTVTYVVVTHPMLFEWVERVEYYSLSCFQDKDHNPFALVYSFENQHFPNSSTKQSVVLCGSNQYVLDVYLKGTSDYKEQ